MTGAQQAFLRLVGYGNQQVTNNNPGCGSNKWWGNRARASSCQSVLMLPHHHVITWRWLLLARRSTDLHRAALISFLGLAELSRIVGHSKASISTPQPPTPCLKNETSTQFRPSARLIRLRLLKKVCNLLPCRHENSFWGKALTSFAILLGKAEAQSRRNEKLARRNPDRIQKEIDDLKAIADGGGKLSKQEEQALETLTRDLKAVKKAREALGDQAPTFGRGGPRRDGDGRGGVLGKRRRDDQDASSSESDVPEDVRNIPMPRDTPPPIPKEVLDKWYAKRRARRNANAERLGERDQGRAEKQPPAAAAPVAEAKTVYESKPVLRDLRKEAVSAFMPTTVRMKVEKGKGQTGLMEPEEADRLEREGYLGAARGSGGGVEATSSGDVQAEELISGPRAVTMEEVDDEG